MRVRGRSASAAAAAAAAAALVLLALASRRAAPKNALASGPPLPPLPPAWDVDPWLRRLRALWYREERSAAFCLGSNPRAVARLAARSFPWPPPLAPRRGGGACANATRVARALCGPDDIELYLRFMILTEDPEKVPASARCPAGGAALECSPGFFSPDGAAAAPCCDGYFCPRGLDCIMPCALGALCLRAEPARPPPALRRRGRGQRFCAPYAYRERTGLGCGGADRWAIAPSDTPFPGERWAAGGGSVFCAGGGFCINATTRLPCPRGHFCREGSAAPERCPPGSICPAGTELPLASYGGAAADAALLLAVATARWAAARYGAAARLGRRAARRRAPDGGEDGYSALADDALEDGGGSAAAAAAAAATRLASILNAGAAPLGVEFERLNVRLRAGGRLVLNAVSGRFAAGRLTAIMGPSGAGKTTLLKALAGRGGAAAAASGGAVRVAGGPDGLARWRAVLGWVPQDDGTLHGYLTVEEALLFSARCRLPAAAGEAGRRRQVAAVLGALGLEPVRAARVGGGLSGGQRRRVSAGVELAAAPLLLLGDEVTSGLDSAAARGLVAALRAVARAGRVTTALTVHQPRAETFRLFDDLILLAPGGRTVYCGPAAAAAGHFEALGFAGVASAPNPADALLDAVAGELARPRGRGTAHPEELAAAWVREAARRAAGEAAAPAPAPPPAARAAAAAALLTLRCRATPGALPQFWWQLQRAATKRAREPLQAFLDFAVVALTGLTLGMLSDRGGATILTYSTQSCVYAVVAAGLLAMVGAAPTPAADGAAAAREAAAGLSRGARLAALDALDAAGLAARAGVFLAAWASLAAPRATAWRLYAVFGMTFYAAAGAAYLLTALLGAGPAQLAAAVTTLLATLLARRPPGGGGALAAAQRLSFAAWSLEGLVVAEADRLRGVWLLARCADLAALGYDVRRFGRCLRALGALGAAARAAAAAALLARRV